MNEAVQWAVEESNAAAGPRALLIAIARKAKGCLAQVSRRELVAEVKIHRSKLYAALSILQEIGELERLQSNNQRAEIRTYHLTKFCSLMSPSGKVCRGHLSASIKGDLSMMSPDRRNMEKMSPCGKLLFPEQLTTAAAREICEECRGTGLREASWSNAYGKLSHGLEPCDHALAKVAGRWKIVPNWRDTLMLRLEPVTEPTATAAQQKGFNYHLAKLEAQKIELQKKGLLAPEPEKKAIPTNVIAMRRMA